MEYIIEKNGKKRKAVQKQCEYCGKTFLVRASWEDTQKFCSNECKHKSKRKRVEVSCAFCGKVFEKPINKLSLSKSGLYFCCREHKDKGQCLENNLNLYPYSTGKRSYRDLAFRLYEHKCYLCGWDEDERILEVHHIDEDRSNNDKDNLVVLCPTCHKYLTLHIKNLKGEYL